MKKIFITVSIFSLALVTHAQWQWAQHIGSGDNDGATGVCDKDGNFYIGGHYNGYTCTFPDTTLHSASNVSNIFLAKFDKNGNEQWIRQLNVENMNNGGNNGIGDIITDLNGNVYITGIFFNELQCDTIHMTASPGGDVFIARFNPDGSCAWARQAGGQGKTFGSGLAVDSVFNVYVCGENTGNISFCGSLTAPGGFLAKYDLTGSCLWAKKMVSYNNQYQHADVQFTCMKINKGHILACGEEAATTFEIDTMTFDHPGLYGHILCCYDLSGAIKWAKEGLSPAALSGINLTADSTGNIYIVGEFFDSISFGGNVLHASGTLDDYFVVKYGVNEEVLWLKGIRSNGISYGGTIISDEVGNFYVSGNFSGISIFGTDTIISDSQSDVFLARYTANGECYGVVHFGNAESLEVGQDNDGNPVIVGKFSGTVSIGSFSFTSYGSDDIFVSKCNQITGIEDRRHSPADQLIIYANPNEGRCTITIPEEFMNEKNLTLRIYDSKGKKNGFVQQPIPTCH